MTMAKTEIKARVPEEIAEAVRVLARARGGSMNDYIQRALRTQLMMDATGLDNTALTRLIQQANESLTRAANFGAVHAAAVLTFLREWAADGYIAAGMPEALARDKAALFAEHSLADALTAFEDPRIRAQFGWIERPPDTEDET